jgi:hypothetical protein
LIGKREEESNFLTKFRWNSIPLTAIYPKLLKMNGKKKKRIMTTITSIFWD